MFRELIEDIVRKVVAVVGLLGSCELLKEAGDDEMEGELAGNQVCFTEPPVVTAGVGIKDDGFVLKDF